MSKKVRFYMMLDLIGVGITFLARALLLYTTNMVTVPWLHVGLVIVINIATIAVCLFILFFFLLYWWSDKKWTNIKQRFKKRGDYYVFKRNC